MKRPLQRLKAADIVRLLEWYSRSRRDFPWRADPRPYWVWLAEIMSQQTTMTALLPYFHRFIDRFPDVGRLAASDESDVLAAWAGLGYYSRARNVHRAARQIAGAPGGAFPRTLEGWLALPGVGPYTAAAVVSQCFGVSEPVWDGNVTRVCSRLAARADAHEKAFRSAAEANLRELMAGHDPSAFNQAMMELGATVCTPKSPSCGRCPVARACEAQRRGEVECFPPPKARRENIDVTARVHVRLRRVKGVCEAFLVSRPTGLWFAGLWDFPSELGGVSRPVVELEGLPSSARNVGQARHQITHHRIRLTGLVQVEERPTKANRSKNQKEGRWISIDELTSDSPPIALSTTARKVLKLVLRSPTDQLALL